MLQSTQLRMVVSQVVELLVDDTCLRRRVLVETIAQLVDGAGVFLAHLVHLRHEVLSHPIGFTDLGVPAGVGPLLDGLESTVEPRGSRLAVLSARQQKRCFA